MRFYFLFPLLLLATLASRAQNPEEVHVRARDDAERIAILHGDTLQLAQLMSRQIIVQNPENRIVGYAQIMERIRTGQIRYARFERVIEKISFAGCFAVVMGYETIGIPDGSTAGKTITRRFTNIWAKEGNNWMLTARQATIVP